MTHTIEQPRFAEQESSPTVREFILPAKSSRELYTGDPTSIIGYDFNDAVEQSQHATGEDDAFDLDAQTFDAIMPSNWRTLSAGEALDAFDRGYKTHVMRMQKVPEAQITTVLSHEDSKSNPDELTQVNGINIPYEIMESDVDATEWALAEQELRLNYVFHQAEYHLGRVFVADGQTYEVTHIEYTGTEGNYRTLTLGFKNLETNQQLLDIPLDKVEALVRSDNPEKTQEIFDELDQDSPEEYEQTTLVDIEQTIQAELERYDREFIDTPDPLERAEFEDFLRGHPSLMTTPANLPDSEEMPLLTPVELINGTPTEELPVPPQELADEVHYDRDPDERTHNLHVAITHLALRHPLSDEMIADTIEKLEEHLEEVAERDETLLQVR